MNKELITLLKKMAFFLELHEENPFKIRAFLKAARTLKEQDILALSEKDLLAIKGIGKGISSIIGEYRKTGRVKELEKLQKKFSPKLWELAEVPGLKAKKIKILVERLAIASPKELEYACQENRLLDLKGFGEKTQKSLLKALSQQKAHKGRVLLPTALEIAKKMKKSLQAIPSVKKVMEVGELRLLSQTIGNIELLVHAAKKLTLSKKNFPFLKLKEGKETSKSIIFTAIEERGLKIRIHLWTPKSDESFAFMTMRLTGSELFWKKIAPFAKKYKKEKSEEKIFASLQLPYFSPEEREVPPRQRVKKEEKLVEKSDLKGIFHVHTKESDGANTLEEMAEACRHLGFSYMGVSEHSRSANYANGLQIDAIKKQKEKINALNERYKDFYIFHGIESDILKNGDLDYPEKILATFDFVIASIHSQFHMKAKEMTKRICSALKNPYTTWLGHPTGRILLGRKGYEFDMDLVLKTAKQEKKGIELNANPYRLDLDWNFLKKTKSLHIPIGIFPDAHSVKGIEDVHYGIIMARKGGLSPKEVSNTKSLSEMKTWLKKH